MLRSMTHHIFTWLSICKENKLSVDNNKGNGEDCFSKKKKMLIYRFQRCERKWKIE